ncbi:ATP-binding component of ABC transporter [Luminiphilus syltensis NOR5-1B]|uniref:ATP-binding component of ABC transporter n=1 Tax=Luminiphilus syltensis NOR5-1B TaxID=565045 RepID=B8KQV0_9GAMM|nr:ABC transporter ATP-binding protein [Luminiphilus syltensis]EED35367.1 ATP-binding component of ABC transporter [Luminiphilus syltensis NOR5-1B]
MQEPANQVPPAIQIDSLSKTFAGGFEALKGVSLDVSKGEIFALLGPNGAGKTTLISIVCGLVNPSGGTVKVEGFDILSDYRETRSRVGLVPQELTTDAFATVFGTVRFSRGLFGKPHDDVYVEQVLRDLSLWEKRDSEVHMLSGGMKRRLLIAKAMVHEPDVLFLDEPTAGVDVELRRDMWNLVRRLRDRGVTIVLTTHYIEEAEEMADRVGVINNGELILVQEKNALMQRLGEKRLVLKLNERLDTIPPTLSEKYELSLSDGGETLTYVYDARGEHTGITGLLSDLRDANLHFTDLDTEQSSLEDIFVNLVEQQR